ncbi:MAG: hypothetical protein K940chlam8_01286 [Chlamydiae bacterium]|nr:hypothetical protein [Chlamydiota bacterium]
MIRTFERFANLQMILNALLLCLLLALLFFVRFYEADRIGVQKKVVIAKHTKTENAPLVDLKAQELLAFPKVVVKACKTFDLLNGKESFCELYINQEYVQVKDKQVLYFDKDACITSRHTPIKMHIKKMRDHVVLECFIEEKLEKTLDIPLIERAFKKQIERINLESKTLDALWCGKDLLVGKKEEKLSLCGNTFYMKQGDMLVFDGKWRQVKRVDMKSIQALLILQKQEKDVLYFEILDPKGKTKLGVELARQEEALDSQSINRLQLRSLRNLKSVVFLQNQKRMHIALKEPLYFVNEEWQRTPSENACVLMIDSVKKEGHSLVSSGRLFSQNKSQVMKVEFVKKHE